MTTPALQRFATIVARGSPKQAQRAPPGYPRTPSDPRWPRGRPGRPRGPAFSARAPSDRSPTTSIWRVSISLATGLLLALLLDARGVVHSGEGMPDGPVRSVTLAVGSKALWAAEAAHLTWPWDHLQAALGRSVQPSTPPLLAGVSGAAPRHMAGPTAECRHVGGGSREPVLSGMQGHPKGPRQAFSGVPGRAATGGRPYEGRRADTQRAPRFAYTWVEVAGRCSRRSVGAASTPGRQMRTAQRTSRHAPAAGSALRPTRAPTWRNPLRLLTTGDSLMGYLGPELIDLASRFGPVRGFDDIHNGTGLTRPDFVDWSVVARQQVAADHLDAVVVLIGGNDFQNMTLPPNRFFLAGSPAWTREYQRRAEVCMRIWAQAGVGRVYWLSVPPARDISWAHDDAQINIALQRAAARVPGAEYLNVLGRVTDHGRYADFVTNPGQPPELVREPDGVHLNITGSDLVAEEVLPTLVREWHLGARPPYLKPHRAAVSAPPTSVSAATGEGRPRQFTGVGRPLLRGSDGVRGYPPGAAENRHGGRSAGAAMVQPRAGDGIERVPTGLPLSAAANTKDQRSSARSTHMAQGMRPRVQGGGSQRLRMPTGANPLRLLVTGDSLTEYLGPELVDEAARAGPVRGLTDTQYGTGLVRPDYVDWSVLASQQVRADNPEAVVVMMGGNDDQNITVPSGQILRAGSPAWTREYERRAAICMRIWAHGGRRRVYWLSVPPARSPAWASVDGQINLALRWAAARVPGAQYLDILGPVTDRGRYADFVRNVQGQPVLVREPDGVHLNMAGSQIVAGEVLAVLRREWHLVH